MSPASALRSPGPESLGLSLQRTNVPQWGQRPGVPWDDLTFPHTCLQPLPVSRPDPDLCLLWHLWVSWGFCTRTGVLTLVVPTGARGFRLLALGCVSYQPASAFRLSRPCRHVRPALVSAPRPVLVGFCLFSPFPATGSEGRRPPSTPPGRLPPASRLLALFPLLRLLVLLAVSLRCFSSSLSRGERPQNAGQRFLDAPLLRAQEAVLPRCARSLRVRVQPQLAPLPAAVPTAASVCQP